MQNFTDSNWDMCIFVSNTVATFFYLLQSVYPGFGTSLVPLHVSGQVESFPTEGLIVFPLQLIQLSPFLWCPALHTKMMKKVWYISST